jgi:hypothetical protein
MEITVTLFHSAQKYKWTNTLESYYIQFFHQHNMISKEQTQKEKKGPLFELTYDIQLHCMGA